MQELSVVFGLTYFTLFLQYAFGIALTFELEDNAKQCFFHDFKKHEGVKSTLEYQVVSGGKYDIDCMLEDPDGLEVYAVKRKQYDFFEWEVKKEGTYKICFSNEFSTISHKIIYFDLIDRDEGLKLDYNTEDKTTTLTQMEVSCVNIHDSLKDVIEFQTHFRLNEAKGRTFAQTLSSSVQIWSSIQLVIIIIAMVGQVFILRSFFSNNRPSQRQYT